jgi:hypothetical protein
MQMRVMQQSGTPTVQDGEEANLGAQVFGIGRYGAQRFGCSLEEDVVYHLLVLVSDSGNLIGHSENDVEVLAVEKFFLTVFYPLCACQRLTLWAMPISA